MGICYQFQRAQKTVAGLTPGQRQRLQALCHEVEAAQRALNQASEPLLTRCLGVCQGLCCRNVQVADIIDSADFVLLLTLAGDLRDVIETRLSRADPLYAADCIFLANGVGPCIFPGTMRPQICLTAFCNDTAPARGEIARIKRKFLKLKYYLFIWSLANGVRR